MTATVTDLGAYRAERDGDPGGILCHCDVGPGGHPPGTGRCAVELRPARIVRFADTPIVRYADAAKDHTGNGVMRAAAFAAVGTCGVCGKAGVRVDLVRTIGINEQATARNGRLTGPLINRAPALREHGPKGARCEGTGQPPVETSYRHGRELASWLAVNGPDSVGTATRTQH